MLNDQEGPAPRVESSYYEEQDSQFLEETIDEDLGEGLGNSLAS